MKTNINHFHEVIILMIEITCNYSQNLTQDYSREYVALDIAPKIYRDPIKKIINY